MRLALALALLVLVAACGSTAPGANRPLTASSATTSPMPGRTSPAAPSPAAAGPFAVSGLHCTGTSLTATVTNVGRTEATVQIQANFLHGSTIEATNVSGFTDGPLRPGQNEQVTVDNVNDAGKAGSASDTCELVSYAVMESGTYAGTWQLPG